MNELWKTLSVFLLFIFIEMKQITLFECVPIAVSSLLAKAKKTILPTEINGIDQKRNRF